MNTVRIYDHHGDLQATFDLAMPVEAIREMLKSGDDTVTKLLSLLKDAWMTIEELRQRLYDARSAANASIYAAEERARYATLDLDKALGQFMEKHS